MSEGETKKKREKEKVLMERLDGKSKKNNNEGKMKEGKKDQCKGGKEREKEGERLSWNRYSSPCSNWIACAALPI